MIETKTRLEFHIPTLEDAAWAAPLLRASGRMACETSFTTIYMWRRHYHNEIATDGTHVFLRTGGEDPVYQLPTVDRLKEGVELLLEDAHARGHKLRLFGEDRETVSRLETLFPGKFSFTPSRDDFDYIYRQSDLSQLAGRKYHGKRNHIAAFSRQYAWEYETITRENIPEVAALAQDWCRQRGNCKTSANPELRAECCAIQEALGHWEALRLSGGLIRVDGKARAFTFGSPINDEMIDVHVEKALPAFAGLYPIINREAVTREWAAYTYINRENDMGLEGLRKAKESYHPAILLEKYIASER